MSVPGALDATGLPLGLQVIARPLDEGTMFSVAGALEKAAGFGAKAERWW
jgi:aspartyl-tRNA(Asn)/glutamyl-tRNA(Gln) amidotransferase subunit A